MMQMIKRLLTLPTPLEMAAKELVEAQRAKLEAESAQDYAEYMVAYNNQRIDRLRERVLELRGEQVRASVKSTPTQIEFTARDGMAEHRTWMHEKLDEWIDAHEEQA